jgi:hypothetical protein
VQAVAQGRLVKGLALFMGGTLEEGVEDRVMLKGIDQDSHSLGDVLFFQGIDTFWLVSHGAFSCAGINFSYGTI